MDILERLQRAVIEYDAVGAASLARQAVQAKMDPIKTLSALTEAIRQVGEGFAKGDLWLPDLVGAADAMTAAMPIVEEEIRKAGTKRESLGIVVLGTVFGDIHTIGKQMVGALLSASGFEVIDLGVNVAPEQFVESVVKYEADIVAMSALMSASSIAQAQVIDILKEKGLRDKVKVMVGGGAITDDFAQSIGADGYSATAPGAAKLAIRLIGEK